ncbi:putative MFS family arabinose efflux permease [Stackebrandtia endophytica]|uniref:Putative MFS family arabinose efflux permease n=1 Tax=Stackebrandtia endophytica TaxID=1496996 RepID=A0A543AZZ6_9ACTN|nr:MFS transporter [Stackebrandtia endophytica]TQL78157.1 putative MFS family arabinose efflux permease [Stackebrandtia endophytica]
MIGRHLRSGPLRKPPFRYYLAARFSSLLGSSLAPIAIAFAVLDLTSSPLALGIVLASRTIPNVVLLLFGGVVADRFRRDHVLVISNTLCALTQAVAALLLFSGIATVWQIAAVEALNGAAAAFTGPALKGILPQLVDRRDLQPANALSGIARNVALVGGGSIAGIIVGFAGSAWGLGVNALTYAVAAFLLSRIRLTDVPRSGNSTIGDLKDGWREFIARQWVWVVVLAFAVVNAITVAGFATLGPVVADESFGRLGWGIISSAQAVGFLLGGVLMLRWRPRRPLAVGVAVLVIDVPVMALLGLHPVLPPLLAGFLLMGIASSIFGVAWESALQQHVPEDRLSRVASYDMVGSFVAIPIGQLIAGPLALAFGLDTVLWMGSILLFVVLLTTLAQRSVRELGQPSA